MVSDSVEGTKQAFRGSYDYSRYWTDFGFIVLVLFGAFIFYLVLIGSDFSFPLRLLAGVVVFLFIVSFPVMLKSYKITIMGDKVQINRSRTAFFNPNTYGPYTSPLAPRVGMSSPSIDFTKQNIKRVSVVTKIDSSKSKARFSTYYATNARKLVLIEFKEPLIFNTFGLPESSVPSFNKMFPPLPLLYLSVRTPRRFVDALSTK